MGTLVIVGSSATQVTDHRGRRVVYTPRRAGGVPVSADGRASSTRSGAGSPGGGA
jgi:hypothetical protein